MKKIFISLAFLLIFGYPTVIEYASIRTFFSPKIIVSVEKQFNIGQKGNFTLNGELENFGGLRDTENNDKLGISSIEGHIYLYPNEIYTAFNFSIKYHYFFFKRNQNIYFSTLLNASLLLTPSYYDNNSDRHNTFELRYFPIRFLLEVGYRFNIKKFYFIDFF